jgi:cytochrome c
MITIRLLCLPLLAITSATAQDAPSFDESRLEATVLADGLPRPLELDVAPDGRVFFIELAGKLKVYHPESGEITLAATLDVFADQENGLLGLTLDPHFATNGWIYLLHSPQTEVFSGQYLSRYTLVGDTLDLASEKLLLKYEEQREECCHHAGSLEFGPNGDLYISTGDNTHPFGDSQSYAPLDERPGRHPYDAQDSAGNTNDLRGKILRIHPTPDGSYTIPEGNLFPEGGPIKGRPEIYVMGCRNPWRMNVDPKTGFVYWGEVGPDAQNDGPRGPRGYDELNQARAAGNFGWPFFIGDNFAYADHDYVTGKTGPFYDPKEPRNISATNTGSELLPPAQPAWIYYPYAASDKFPMLGSGGRTACAGPVYRFDSALKSQTKFPAYFDNCLIFFDWERRFVKTVRLDEDSNIRSIDPFLTKIPLLRPVDMRFGPEGALYVLDYGSTWGDNADSRLLRIDYYADNRPPVAKITASETVGRQPFKVTFSAKDSSDRDASDTLSYRWSVQPGDFPETTTPETAFTFTKPGDYLVSLSVSDNHGAANISTESVHIGNSKPLVRFLEPVDGGFFNWGDAIPCKVEIADAEDGRSAEIGEAMKMRFLLTRRYLSSAPQDAEAAHLAGGGKHATAINTIKSSDCFNCHSVDHRIVGPAFREIATRYAGNEEAINLAASHIIAGSSKVWGEVPMLPHPQFSESEARSLVQWIVSLKDEESRETATQSLSGTFTAKRPEWFGDTAGGFSEWEAAYTDFGAEGANPLAGRATARLRVRQVEGEHFTSRQGTQTLGSGSAAGGQFIGSISPGNYLVFDRVNLLGIGTITARVASPSTGGVVELRQGGVDGPLVAEIPFKSTGEWERWNEISAPVKDPGGIGDLYCIFVNPKSTGPFMNLDWLRFEK